MKVTLSGNRVTGYEPFVEGWLQAASRGESRRRARDAGRRPASSPTTSRARSTESATPADRLGAHASAASTDLAEGTARTSGFRAAGRATGSGSGPADVLGHHGSRSDGLPSEARTAASSSLRRRDLVSLRGGAARPARARRCRWRRPDSGGAPHAGTAQRGASMAVRAGVHPGPELSSRGLSRIALGRQQASGDGRDGVVRADVLADIAPRRCGADASPLAGGMLP